MSVKNRTVSVDAFDNKIKEIIEEVQKQYGKKEQRIILSVINRIREELLFNGSLECNERKELNMSVIKKLNVEEENGIAQYMEAEIKIGSLESVYSAKVVDGEVEVSINGNYIDSYPISYQEELRVNDLYEAIAIEINETLDSMPINVDHVPETYSQYRNECMDAIFENSKKLNKAGKTEYGD